MDAPVWVTSVPGIGLCFCIARLFCMCISFSETLGVVRPSILRLRRRPEKWKWLHVGKKTQLQPCFVSGPISPLFRYRSYLLQYTIYRLSRSCRRCCLMKTTSPITVTMETREKYRSPVVCKTTPTASSGPRRTNDLRNSDRSDGAREVRLLFVYIYI